MTIIELIDKEFKGSDGPLGYNSTQFEYDLAECLAECRDVIKALVEQCQEYSENEHVIGRNNSYKIDDILELIGEQKTYRVGWVIDVEATSPTEAAKQAVKIHRDGNSSANCFTVTDKNGPEKEKVIDLGEIYDPNS